MRKNSKSIKIANLASMKSSACNADFREKGFFLTTTEFAEYRSIFHNTALLALRCAGFGLLHRDLVNMA